ncbi:DinB family protein [Tengunoibacter tsumagoiensis]|uniref:DinB-like domain-containing protein n=1 Tax=Tengunoibacter tsumagoiensis TaxID=2014871 RepID=A0A402A8M6_9CHLR|nr:DinB family protein [Tengunoibacter tsumagoiensis]GCE15517.1 hypothetical protein KTT_53760 [Tengunoibacter tsumagoiensis]
MIEQAPSLFTFYQGWKTYQRMLVEMLAPLSPEHLALPIASDQRTIGMVVQHLIANRVWWFQVWMGEGSADLAPIAHWDPSDVAYQPVSDAATLISGSESTWGMIEETLSHWTHADLGHIFQPPAALSEEERANVPPFSRQWIIWHTFEHEIHHGGELSLALSQRGLMGIYGDL